MFLELLLPPEGPELYFKESKVQFFKIDDLKNKANQKFNKKYTQIMIIRYLKLKYKGYSEIFEAWLSNTR